MFKHFLLGPQNGQHGFVLVQRKEEREDSGPHMKPAEGLFGMGYFIKV